MSETLRQQTTELQKPELELQTKTEDAPEGSQKDKNKESDFDGAGGEGAEILDATELAKQLQKAIDTGEVKVETLGENVVINFPEEKTSDEDVSTMIAETLEALSEAREKAGASESDVLFGGIEAELEKLAAAIDEADPNESQKQGGSSSEQQETKQDEISRLRKALAVAQAQANHWKNVAETL